MSVTEVDFEDIGQSEPFDPETGEVEDTGISQGDAVACKFRSPRHDLFSRGAKYHPKGI